MLKAALLDSTSRASSVSQASSVATFYWPPEGWTSERAAYAACKQYTRL
jgi:hypothetical protein